MPDSTKRTTAEDRRKMLDAYRKHGTVTAAAEATGFARSSVRAILAREGVHTSTPRTAVSDEERAEMAERYAAGETIREIAQDMGRDPKAVSRHLKLAGVEVKAAGPPPGPLGPGRVKANGGYVKVLRPDHPNAQSKGYVMEHRLVMEEKLGRYLQPHETVHHRNGIRTDNRPENLELWVRHQPYGKRVADLLEHAVDAIDEYGLEHRPTSIARWARQLADRAEQLLADKENE